MSLEVAAFCTLKIYFLSHSSETIATWRVPRFPGDNKGHPSRPAPETPLIGLSPWLQSEFWREDRRRSTVQCSNIWRSSRHCYVPSLRLGSAIHIPFSEPAGRGERRGKRRQRQSRLRVVYEPPLQQTLPEPGPHSNEAWDKAAGAPPALARPRRRRLRAGESCCPHRSSRQLCCHSPPKSNSLFRSGQRLQIDAQHKAAPARGAAAAQRVCRTEAQA